MLCQSESQRSTSSAAFFGGSTASMTTSSSSPASLSESMVIGLAARSASSQVGSITQWFLFCFHFEPSYNAHCTVGILKLRLSYVVLVILCWFHKMFSKNQNLIFLWWWNQGWSAKHCSVCSSLFYNCKILKFCYFSFLHSFTLLHKKGLPKILILVMQRFKKLTKLTQN